MIWSKPKPILIDLDEYEAMLIRSRDAGATVLPKYMPIEQPDGLTEKQQKKVADNQVLANELWRKYTLELKPKG